MNTLFFSIIIPIYNTARSYLEACLDSILNQTFADFEVILVDDGSKEECGKMCDAFAEKDSRISVIHSEKNMGVSAARNTGIRAAKADWIMFADADDWYDREAFAGLRKLLQEKDCDILQFTAVREFADKQEIMEYGLEKGRTYDVSDVSDREFLYRKAMATPNTFGARCSSVTYCWDKAYKRTFLTENRLSFCEGLPKSEDKLFVLCCYEKLGKLYYADDVLYHYRINSASVCNSYSAKADTDRIMLGEQLKTVAVRMDKELGELKGESDYSKITNDYYRFMFGIISDVLFLKYYHQDNPDRKNRNREAKKFLKTEPFKSALRKCRYKDLSNNARLKKFLLSTGMVSVFCSLKRKSVLAAGKIAEKAAQ